MIRFENRVESLARPHPLPQALHAGRPLAEGVDGVKTLRTEDLGLTRVAALVPVPTALLRYLMERCPRQPGKYFPMDVGAVQSAANIGNAHGWGERLIIDTREFEERP